MLSTIRRTIAMKRGAAAPGGSADASSSSSSSRALGGGGGGVDDALAASLGVPLHGVSVKHLRSLEVGGGSTMHDVVAAVVRPATAETKTTYAEWLLASPKTAKCVSRRAEVFVSYAWGGTWYDLVTALEAAGLANAFVWIDAFVVNQHDDVDVNVVLPALKPVIEAIGSTLMVLAPWDKPTLTSRAWCVFEALAAFDAGPSVTRRCVLPPTEREKLGVTMRTEKFGLKTMLDVFASVNVAACEASSPMDFNAIRAAIGSRTDVTEAVVGPIKAFYRDVMVGAAADLTGVAKGEAYAFMSVGALFTARGELDEALEWYRKAVDAHRSPGSGSTEADTALALSNLAMCLSDLGKIDEALELHLEALELDKLAVGEEDPDVATDLTNIGLCLSKQGKHGEALAKHEEALAIRKKVLGKDHPDVAQTLTHMASCLSKQRKHDAALKHLREVLEMRQRTLGADSLDVAVSLNSIASSLGMMGKHEEALEAYKESLAIRRRALGDESPDVANALHNMAWCLSELGRLDEALKANYEALKIRKAVFGEDHASVAQSLNNIALCLTEQERYNDAIMRHQQALEIRKRVLGPEHADVAQSLNNLALCLYEKDSGSPEAARRGREALEMAERVLGKEHPTTREYRESWG